MPGRKLKHNVLNQNAAVKYSGLVDAALVSLKKTPSNKKAEVAGTTECKHSDHTHTWYNIKSTVCAGASWNECPVYHSIPMGEDANSRKAIKNFCFPDSFC